MILINWFFKLTKFNYGVFRNGINKRNSSGDKK